METGIKNDALEMVRELPDDITWEDLAYHFYVRYEVEMGIVDAESGRVVSMDDMRKQFGLGRPRQPRGAA